MTNATVQKLESALRDGFSIDMACHVSGVGRSTYYQHLQSNPDFADKMTLAQDWTTQRAKQVVAQAVDSGDLKAAQWWLVRHMATVAIIKSITVLEQLAPRGLLAKNLAGT